MPTDVVVMLENKLSGRPRCYTTSASSLGTTTTTTSSAAAAATTITGENNLKVPLISIMGRLVNNVNSTSTTNLTTTNYKNNNIDRSISKENNLSTASTPLASSRDSSNPSIDLAGKQLASDQISKSPSAGTDSNNDLHPHLLQHPNSHQLINGFDSDKSGSQSSLKRETCI